MEETEDVSDGLAMDEWRDVGSTELLLVLMCGGGDDVRPGGVALESPTLGGFFGGGGGARKRMGLMGVRPSPGGRIGSVWSGASPPYFTVQLFLELYGVYATVSYP